MHYGFASCLPTSETTVRVTDSNSWRGLQARLNTLQLRLELFPVRPVGVVLPAYS